MPLNPLEGAAEYVSVSGSNIQIQSTGNAYAEFKTINSHIGSGNTFVAILIDPDNYQVWEKGVFTVHTDGDGGFISRDRIIETSKGLTNRIDFTSSGNMVLASITPQTPFFFSIPNSILTANIEYDSEAGTGGPSALEVNTNSLIGRTTGNIAPLEASEVRSLINVEDGANLHTPADTINDIQAHTSDLTLPINNLRLYNPSFPNASVRSPIFHAQPYTDSTRPNVGEAGRIIFNASVSPSGGLQVDNGTDWVNV